MEDLPDEPRNLRFLRRLVTVLTATMIIGIATIVTLLFIRFSSQTPAPARISLPDRIELPADTQALAVTAGPGWYAVVTTDSRLLVFDAETGALRQSVEIATD